MTKQPSLTWTMQFFRRVDPKAVPIAPALAFLEDVPTTVAAEIMASIDAVVAGPPPSFRGGLRYKAMHGDMTGWHEVRTKHDKRLYRLFCLQDRVAPGLPGPALVAITGGVKANESAFPARFYKQVRNLGAEYLASDPRSVM